MVDVKRRKGESSRVCSADTHAASNRAEKYWKHASSDIIHPEPTKNKLKASAIRRNEIRVKRDYLSCMDNSDEPKTQKDVKIFYDSFRTN